MIIKTDKFIIRNITPRDWQELYNIFEDFQKGEYRIYDYPVLLERENIIRLCLTFSLQEMFFGVFTPGENRMMGYISVDHEGGIFEIGYCFHSDFHGKGIAYNSCMEVMDYLMREYVVMRFTASTALSNIPSVRLLERLGFGKSGEEELSFHKDESGNPISFIGGIFEREIL